MKTIPLLPGTADNPRPFRHWLQELPPQSIARLRAINLSTAGSHHVILALTYGIYDENIRTINGTITTLLLARLKAERAEKHSLVARINDFMNEMHESIDAVTGTAREASSEANACNRPMKPKLAR
ncbi:MAG TPA: hypothetical protein V6C72_08505 [Chroococcales cyanobacterium]